MTNRLSDATSADGLSPEDFRVAGEKAKTYRYPFSKESVDYSQTPNSPWADSLPEADRGADGIYRQENFDLNEAVTHIKDPILEVGGPTTKGYDFLNGVDLPGKPLMVNMRGSRAETKGGDSLTAVDSLALDALGDVRALPVADESLGMFMCANLPGAPEETMRAIAEQMPPAEQFPAVLDAVDNMYSDAADKLEANDIAALEAHDAPRIAAIAQANRVLKPGGLFVAQGLEARDVAFAKALGLELVMHTPRQEFAVGDRKTEVIKELVFKKPRA